MQEITQAQVIKEPSTFPWMASLAFFVLTVVATAGLIGYGFVQDQRITSLTEQSAQMESDIQAANKDKKILIANILESNTLKPSINVNDLVRNFRTLAIANGVRMQGFSVANDTISTNLSAIGDATTGADAIKTIIDMMRNKSGMRGFSLEPIYTVDGDSAERKTAASFKIVPNAPTASGETTPNAQ